MALPVLQQVPTAVSRQAEARSRWHVRLEVSLGSAQKADPRSRQGEGIKWHTEDIGSRRASLLGTDLKT